MQPGRTDSCGGRHRPSLGFWLMVTVLGLLVIYPLSYGPAAWMVERGILPIQSVAVAYRPLAWLCFHGPPSLERVIARYDSTWRRGVEWERLGEYGIDGSSPLLYEYWRSVMPPAAAASPTASGTGTGRRTATAAAAVPASSR